jgi:hypothetical protein
MNAGKEFSGENPGKQLLRDKSGFKSFNGFNKF